jgi:hypothetical protein
MYTQRGAEVLACGMAICETLAQKAANGNGNQKSCSDRWRRVAGAWEQLLRSDARTLRLQRMSCYEG